MHKTILSTIALAGLLSGGAVAEKDILLAEWTFETSVPINAGPHVAEGGIVGGQANGFHASKATVWSNPVGNGSPESFSSNNWSIGDYYEFSTSTVGYDNIQFGWSITRSGTGPVEWVAQWSDDGIDFHDLFAFEVVQLSWTSNPAGVQKDSIFAPIALPEAANDLETVWVRLVATAEPSGGPGTARVDDVYFISAKDDGKKPGDPCLGDINGDGAVDGADLGLLLTAWGSDNASADLNNDGIVDGADLGLLLTAWGECPKG